MSDNATIELTTADKLWAALHSAPGSTSAELAEKAGIGGSTARKLLVALERNGAAIRTAGESDGSARRPADGWWPKSDAASADADEVEATDPADTADAAAVVRNLTMSTAAANDATDGESEADTPNVNGEIDSVGTDPENPDGFDAATPELEDLPHETSDDTEEPAHDAPAMQEEAVKPQRLGKGALRGMVEDFMADCAGREFTPSQLAKDLNRSAGAIHNALEKLVGEGAVTRTCDAPKRYTIAPGE